MNELTVFENKDFGQIRTVLRQGEPWFVAADVCKVLGHTNPTVALQMLDEDEKAKQSLGQVSVNGVMQNRESNIVSEAGLYQLVIRSNVPGAKSFKRWITHEVIPSIRKTGSYSAGNDIKAMRAEAMMRNAKTREANLWLKFAAVLDSRPHKQLCASYGTQVLTGGQRVLPLPEVEKTYSAEEVGAMLGGLSGQKVGRIATKHGLKVPEYGRLTLDKSRYSNKEVETWRYNEAGVEALRQIVDKE